MSASFYECLGADPLIWALGIDYLLFGYEY
jgi:hypothetical protein